MNPTIRRLEELQELAELREKLKDLTPIDCLELDKALAGMTIVGAEPVSYPLVDGIILYTKDLNGKTHVMTFGADLSMLSDDVVLEATFDELPEKD